MGARALRRLLRRAGRLAQAAGADRRALRLVPGYVHARAGLARIDASRGDYEAVARRLGAVVSQFPTVENAVLLADALRRDGRAKRARRAVRLDQTLERLLEANGVRTELQSALFDLDRGHRAAAALARARAAYRAAPSVYAADAVAWGLARTGRCDAAQGWSDRALRIDTREALFLFHRGWIERCAGRPAAARTLFRAALARIARSRRAGPRWRSGSPTRRERDEPARARRLPRGGCGRARPRARRLGVRLGNFTVNHYAGIELAGTRIYVHYVLDLAEIPAFQIGDEVRSPGYAGRCASARAHPRRTSDRPCAGATPSGCATGRGRSRTLFASTSSIGRAARGPVSPSSIARSRTGSAGARSRSPRETAPGSCARAFPAEAPRTPFGPTRPTCSALRSTSAPPGRASGPARRRPRRRASTARWRHGTWEARSSRSSGASGSRSASLLSLLVAAFWAPPTR